MPQESMNPEKSTKPGLDQAGVTNSSMEKGKNVQPDSAFDKYKDVDDYDLAADVNHDAEFNASGVDKESDADDKRLQAKSNKSSATMDPKRSDTASSTEGEVRPSREL